MINTAIIIALAWILGGCAVVVVKADGGKPELSAWPLGVRVARGSADAIGVRQIGLGLSLSCAAANLGISSSFCVVIDDRACTAAIMEGHPSPAAKGLLNKIINQAEFDCLGKQEGVK